MTERSTPRERRLAQESAHPGRPNWQADLDFGRGILAPKGEDPALGVAYVDLPRRAVAFFLDVLMTQITATLLLQVAGFVAGITLLQSTGVTDNALSAWLGFALPTIAVAVLQGAVQILFLRSYRATPGQLILGLHTLRAADGRPLGKGRALLRWLLTFMPAWAIAASSNIGIWWAAGVARSPAGQISSDAVVPSGLSITLPVIWFTIILISILLSERGQGIHDRLAGSVVVQRTS